MSNDLYLPMATYVFYIWVLALYNFKTRIQAVKTGEVKGSYFKTYEGDVSRWVLTVGRHYDNQMQLPLLFFISCLAQIQKGSVTQAIVVAAWFFVASRFLHSYLHLGENHPLKRAGAFAMGWAAIVFMWGHLILT